MSARARLMSVLVLSSGIACGDSGFMPPRPLIEISATPSTLEADGATPAVISLDVPSALADGTEVTFETDLGRFLSIGGDTAKRVTTVSRGGAATAHLISSTELGEARIVATALGTSISTSVTLIAAKADTIVLTLDRRQAPPDGATAITATAVLARSVGRVTPGREVAFEVRDTGADTILHQLSGIGLSDSSGVATVKMVSFDVLDASVVTRSDSASSVFRLIRFR